VHSGISNTNTPDVSDIALENVDWDEFIFELTELDKILSGKPTVNYYGPKRPKSQILYEELGRTG